MSNSVRKYLVFVALCAAAGYVFKSLLTNVTVEKSRKLCDEAANQTPTELEGQWCKRGDEWSLCGTSLVLSIISESVPTATVRRGDNGYIVIRGSVRRAGEDLYEQHCYDDKGRHARTVSIINYIDASRGLVDGAEVSTTLDSSGNVLATAHRHWGPDGARPDADNLLTQMSTLMVDHSHRALGNNPLSKHLNVYEQRGVIRFDFDPKRVRLSSLREVNWGKVEHVAHYLNDSVLVAIMKEKPDIDGMTPSTWSKPMYGDLDGDGVDEVMFSWCEQWHDCPPGCGGSVIALKHGRPHLVKDIYTDTWDRVEVRIENGRIRIRRWDFEECEHYLDADIVDVRDESWQLVDGKLVEDVSARKRVSVRPQ